MLRLSIAATALAFLIGGAAVGAPYPWYPADRANAALDLIDASGDGSHFQFLADRSSDKLMQSLAGKSPACLDAAKAAYRGMVSTTQDFLVMSELRFLIMRFKTDEMVQLTAFFRSPAGMRYRAALEQAVHSGAGDPPNLLYAPVGSGVVFEGRPTPVRPDYLRIAMDHLTPADAKTVTAFTLTDTGSKFFNYAMRELASGLESGLMTERMGFFLVKIREYDMSACR